MLASFGALGVSALQAAETLSLEHAVSEALASNPGLAAIDQRARALAHVPDQVGALPDPSLSLNMANLPLDSFSFTQEPMTQFQVGITQALPYPGKLALHVQAAEQEAGAAQADVAERSQQLTRDVKTVWWNLFYLDRALEVIARNQTLLSDVVTVAQTRYEVGRGGQQDVLLAQLELSRLRESAIRIRNMRENEATRLNVLMDRSPSGNLQLPDSVAENVPALATLEVLQQSAGHSRQVLAAQQMRKSAAETRVDLAKTDRWPDFRVGATYGLRSGNNADGSDRADFGTFMFSVNLPIHASRNQDRAVDQRSAEALQQQYLLHDRQNLVASEVRQASTDYQLASEQVQLFRQEILPQARQALDAMLAGYQVGRVEFLSLIRSQTILFDHETQYWKALSTTNQALARMIAAVGEEDKVYE
jgi:outer membrane protein TolC